MGHKTYLFLDFDGVIGDSIDECLVSSWLAHHEISGEPAPDRMPLGARAQFAAIRPFIRSGEDYVLVQKILHSGGKITSQQDFDRHLSTAGAEAMEQYGQAFYLARGKLLETDPEYWLLLNRLYSHVVPVLRAHAADDRVYIMSTKKSSFILRILHSHEIPIDPDRVIWSGSDVKVDIVSDIISRQGGGDGILIDDQIDHLLKPRRDNVDVRLALWGYVKPEWRDSYPEVLKIDEKGWDRLIQSWG